MRPEEVVHDRGRNVLEIRWEDGTLSVLPASYLRGWCPCAVCQGHGTVVRHHPPTAPVAIDGLHEIGAYAIAIRFSDGHDCGIYAWTHLRSIAPESPPVGLKRGAFTPQGYVPGDAADAGSTGDAT
jgi:DUF971 family protein